jgi:predicted NBD/HSP70 family sugar kinase
MKVLVVDVGGTSIKVAATGRRTRLRIPSGKTMTPRRMVDLVRQATRDWEYDAVSIGYPGPVHGGKPAREPHNLGRGWTRFAFDTAFNRPVRVINDAAMQALGSYRRGRMLFLGLGTGLGSALIVDGVVAPLELAHLPYRKGRTYEQYVGKAGLKRLGRDRWRRHVAKVTEQLGAALDADEIVLGGGNAQLLHSLPAGARRGSNRHAFAGGYRLWRQS